MTTLYHQVWIDATAAKVYSAIATADGLGRWWAAHTSTETAAGLVLTHNPGDEHGEVKMKVLATIQDRRIEWEIDSTHPKRSPASAWTGTRIVFDIAWARERRVSRLSLWAPAHSVAALSLYRRAGFRETGIRRPLPTNPALQIVEMESQL